MVNKRTMLYSSMVLQTVDKVKFVDSLFFLEKM